MSGGCNGRPTPPSCSSTRTGECVPPLLPSPPIPSPHAPCPAPHLLLLDGWVDTQKVM